MGRMVWGLVVLACLLFGAYIVFAGNMEEITDSIDAAYDQANSVQYSRDLRDAQTRARAGMGDAQSAENTLSSDGGQYDATQDMGNTYDYMYKASRANSEADAAFFSQQAARSAREARDSLNYDSSDDSSRESSYDW